MASLGGAVLGASGLDTDAPGFMTTELAGLGGGVPVEGALTGGALTTAVLCGTGGEAAADIGAELPGSSCEAAGGVGVGVGLSEMKK